MQRLAGLMLSVFLAACSDGFKAKTLPGGASSSSQGAYNPDDAVALVPASDKMDSGCMGSAQYDTCIFNKNPVAQQSASLNASTRTALVAMQTYGVKLTGLGNTGFLENSHFRITTNRTARLALSGNKKPLASAATSSDLEQLVAYYYLNRAIEYFGPRGPLAVRGQNLNVVVDERVSGYEPVSRTIQVARKPDALPAGFDASVPVYLLGLANAYLANGNALNNIPLNDPNHRLCGLDAKGCCATNAGCARAIAAGAAFYFTAVIFPTAPVVGELDANRLAGARICGVADRDLRTITDLTAATAHSLCSSRMGDVQILGGVYASVWWQLRNAVTPDSYDFDFLYLHHLSRLTGGDTFATAKQKILDVDRELFEGKYSSRIMAEFARRGL